MHIIRSFGFCVNAVTVVDALDVDATGGAAIVVDTAVADVVVPLDLRICNRIEQILLQCFPNAGTRISFALGIDDTIIRFPAVTSFSIR